MKHWWISLFGDSDVIVDEAGIRNALSDKERLISTIRPYLDKGLTSVPTWMTGDLVAILGVGVMDVALKEARELDPYPGTKPYYDSIATDIAYQRGDWDEVQNMESWLEKIYLKWNTDESKIVLLEVAHDERGDFDAALTRWSQAMEIDHRFFDVLE